MREERETVQLDMHHLLVLLLLSSGLQAEEKRISTDPVRLVDGTSPCSGRLEVKSNQSDKWWSSMCDSSFTQTLKKAARVCRELDCGSAVSVGQRTEYPDRSVWIISSPDTTPDSSRFILDVTCLDSVRLVDGTNMCSGRLEVKSNQRWSSVCEADFDQQDAEVVCRELGCGSPSVLQGVLHGEVEAPMWTKEFQCGGNESSLLDCRSSGADRNKCSTGKAVGLICSEPVRLVGENSRCAGTLQVKHNDDWRPVHFSTWTQKELVAACRELDCGSAVSVGERVTPSQYYTWSINSECLQSGSLRECATSDLSSSSLNLICSELLLQPNISVSSSMDGASEAQQQGLRVSRGSDFTISCSVQPQYPGGSFQLSFTSYNSAHNYTQPAVNHSAHFQFHAAKPAHQGSYSCAYQLYVFSYNFSSESRLLSVSVLDPTPFIIRVVVLPLTLLLVNTSLYCYFKASRGQKPDKEENMELDSYNLDVPAAEEEGAQGAE